MFDELSRYKEKGSFILNQKDNLSIVCNAPNQSSGIYLIYENSVTERNLIYIGISGRVGENGSIIHRKDGLRGRFLTGKTEGILRKYYWPQLMALENVQEIHICWFVTFGMYNHDIPRNLEIKFLNEFFVKYNRLPRWNKKI